MTVEEGARFLISAGLVTPEFKGDAATVAPDGILGDRARTEPPTI